MVLHKNINDHTKNRIFKHRQIYSDIHIFLFRQNFLDIKLKIENQNIIIDWYHKNTHSGRYLSYYSNHPICHKIGTIYSLIDRAMLLSHPKYQEKNITLVINTLIENGYPLDFIFKYTHVRIKKLIATKLKFNHGAVVGRDEKEKSNRFIAVPYIKNLSEFVCNSFRGTEFAAGYKCFNRLNRFIKVHKDITPTECNNNVIYKIHCKDCTASYVGQTKRQLKTRIHEHKINIRQHTSNQSVVSQHITDYKHNMDWDNVKILDHETNYYKRLIAETIHIKQQKNSLNAMDDTEYLDRSYFPLLESIGNTET